MIWAFFLLSRAGLRQAFFLFGLVGDLDWSFFFSCLAVQVSDFLTRSFNSSGDVGKGVVAKKGCSREI